MPINGYHVSWSDGNVKRYSYIVTSNLYEQNITMQTSRSQTYLCFILVNWSAKSEIEYVANYKMLQTVMTKNHVDKFVDVDRLVKGVSYCYNTLIMSYDRFI